MALCDFDTPTTVFLGYGNFFPVQADYGLVELESVTKVEFCIAGITVDSDDDPAHVWWDADAQQAVIRPGLVTGLTVGEATGALIVYDGDHTDGQVVAYNMPFNVIEVCS